MNRNCQHKTYCPLCASGKKNPGTKCELKEVHIDNLSLLKLVKKQCENLGIDYSQSKHFDLEKRKIL